MLLALLLVAARWSGAGAALPASDAAALRRSVLDGAVLLPDDAGFKQACAIKMRGTCRPSMPDAVVQPRSARDVIAAVRFAALRRAALTIKSGGHSYSCESSALGGLLLDMHAGADWVEPFVGQAPM